MTFNEAVEYKKSLGDGPFEIKMVQLQLFVVPKKIDDFDKYVHHWHFNNIDSDEAAMLFSSDNEYSVYGFGYFMDKLFHESF